MSRARSRQHTGAQARATQPAAVPPGSLSLRTVPEGTLLPVRAVPRAARTGLDGIADGALRVRLTARPVEGVANAALIDYLASLLGLPKSAITIVSGATARQKALLIRGLTPADVQARLGI